MSWDTRSMSGGAQTEVGPIVLAFALTLVGFVVLAASSAVLPAVSFRPISVEETGQHFFRFVGIALVTERFVEVLVLAFSRAFLGPADDANRDSTSDRRKQRVAHLASFMVAGLLALSGFRVLHPLLLDGSLLALGPVASRLFATLDVLLTAGLLTGGADGLHRVIEALTKGIEMGTGARARPPDLESRR